jgi:hypothetical protein
MTLQTKALLYQFLCFAVLFIAFRFLVDEYSRLSGYWIPITAFVISTILCPQFKVVRTPQGEKLLMKWIFMKGFKEIK